MMPNHRESQKCYAHPAQGESDIGLFHFDPDWITRLRSPQPPEPESLDLDGIPLSPDVFAEYADLGMPLGDEIAEWGRAAAWDAYEADGNPYGPYSPYADAALAERWLRGWRAGTAEIVQHETQDDPT